MFITAVPITNFEAVHEGGDSLGSPAGTANRLLLGIVPGAPPHSPSDFDQDL